MFFPSSFYVLPVLDINSHLFLKPTFSVAFKNNCPKPKWQNNLLFRDSPTWCYIHFMHGMYTDLKQKPRRNHFLDVCIRHELSDEVLWYHSASSTIRYIVRNRKIFFFWK